jgi:hypothetical protein
LNRSEDTVSSGPQALLYSPQLIGFRVSFHNSRPQFIKGQSNLCYLIRETQYYIRFKDLGVEPSTPVESLTTPLRCVDLVKSHTLPKQTLQNIETYRYRRRSYTLHKLPNEDLRRLLYAEDCLNQ